MYFLHIYIFVSSLQIIQQSYFLRTFLYMCVSHILHTFPPPHIYNWLLSPSTTAQTVSSSHLICLCLVYPLHIFPPHIYVWLRCQGNTVYTKQFDQTDDTCICVSRMFSFSKVFYCIYVHLKLWRYLKLWDTCLYMRLLHIYFLHICMCLTFKGVLLYMYCIYMCRTHPPRIFPAHMYVCPVYVCVSPLKVFYGIYIVYICIFRILHTHFLHINIFVSYMYVSHI